MLRDLLHRPLRALPLLLSLAFLVLKLAQLAAGMHSVAMAGVQSSATAGTHAGPAPATEALPLVTSAVPLAEEVPRQCETPDAPDLSVADSAADEGADDAEKTGESSEEVTAAPVFIRRDDPLQTHNRHLLAAIRAPQLAPRVHVAVLDGPVRTDHPDLPPIVSIRPRLRTPDGDCGGEDCCPRRAPLRPSGHATSVAGLIAAVRENGHGIAGLADVGDLVSIEAPVEGRDGDLRLAAALRCAIEYRGSDGRPLRVVNMSLGLQGIHGTALRDALQAASDAGLLLVSSAGNKGRDITRLPRWPASFNSAAAITVEARRYDGTLSKNSNRGFGIVDLGAPAPEPDEAPSLCTTSLAGPTSYNDDCSGDYNHFDRTSAAAAVVSGAAARVWRDPRYAHCTAAQMRRLLMATGRFCRYPEAVGLEGICMLDLGFLAQPGVVGGCGDL